MPHYPQPYDPLADLLTEKGFVKTTKSEGSNLGAPNGVFTLTQLNKLITLAFVMGEDQKKYRT